MFQNLLISLKRLILFILKDKKRGNYRIIITPPYTLIGDYSKYFKKKKIQIGSQNCYHKDLFSSNTGAISPFMIKKSGAIYTLIGHSDNRGEGDTDTLLKDKVKFSLRNNLKIVYCIGESKKQKKIIKLKLFLKSNYSKFWKKNLIVTILS